ncbi:polysaccharide pyruvyl transferase family protein [Clostridium gasigenes]|uniref:Polysaccharide pyruvyl transferase family protein WcaK n=1 Tax=Clostridium gasigenes TaxID=94869 RepID=A0A1H0PN53_9CLOT|nr:polysaccharide pyruvyl transferase family protein [Clostridium gasigenes]SDP06521.1 Polysaccharide pyruvyl transferase family protein WcaK [Clostridium gasigenes]
MKEAIIISFFDSENIGDIILSEKLYQEYKKKIKVKRIDFLTGKLMNESKKYITINKINENNYNNEKTIKYKLKKNNIISEIVNLKDSLKTIKNIDWSSVEKEIKSTDILIIGGGNMLMGLSYDFPMILNKYTKIAKKFNKEIRIVSVGVGPFKNKIVTNIVKQSVKNIKHISTRDKISQEKLQAITKRADILLSCDPALLYDNITNMNKKEKIGVSIYPYKDPYLNTKGNSKEYEKYITEFANLINDIHIRFNKEIVLFSTEANDYKCVKEVYDKLYNTTKSDTTISYIYSFDQVIELYNQIKILIGTRLHSMIIAYTQEIPLIGLSWQPKVDGFFEYIEKDSYKFNIADIGEKNKEILDKCIYINNNYEKYINEIRKRKSKIINEFNINLVDL